MLDPSCYLDLHRQLMRIYSWLIHILHLRVVEIQRFCVILLRNKPINKQMDTDTKKNHNRLWWCKNIIK